MKKVTGRVITCLSLLVGLLSLGVIRVVFVIIVSLICHYFGFDWFIGGILALMVSFGIEEVFDLQGGRVARKRRNLQEENGSDASAGKE